MPDSERDACLRLLDEAAGTPVRIAETHHLGSEWAPVERLVLAADYPRIGRSVVVKTRRREEAGWGSERTYLIAEHRALALLADVGAEVAPTPLGFDEAAGVLVMEDLGTGPTVERVLFDGTDDEARVALVGLAASVGQVHAATTSIGSAGWNEFAQYGRWAALPEDVVTAADRAYRAELAKRLPWTMGDDAYGQAMAAGCAAWAIGRLSRLDKIAAADQEPDVRLRRCSQIVHTVESCRATAAETGSFPNLMGWLGAVTEEMRRRWPEANAEPGRFPAFARESQTDD